MITRRSFFWLTAALNAAVRKVQANGPGGARPDRLRPIGEGRGIHPGRVVWVHDPQAIDWKGPGNGHWYESQHAPRTTLMP